MAQIPIVNGIYTDGAPGFRTAYPRNLVAIPKSQGISNGYLASADGIEQFATGQGADRGGINWNGQCYRVSGTKLIKVSAAGAVTVLGDVGGGAQVSLDYSFDRLAIASGGRLYYWNGSTLTQVTDPDLGTVVDALWVAGYFMTTDGEFLVVTELNDPFAVSPLKYGSSEADPDPVKALLELRNEVYALNRYTIEVFQNVGGDLFPFQRVEGAQVPRGVVGTHACCLFAETIAFVGSGRNEAPAVYLVNSGTAVPISTREIEQTLAGYSETQLESVVLESRLHAKQQQLYLHLPDQCLVYDVAASAALGEPVWYAFTTSIDGLSQYRARGIVYCYDKWIVGDPSASRIGVLTDAVDTHYGEEIGWEFSTQCAYNDSRGAIVHELELVALTGAAPLGADPVIFTSYSTDGQTWSQERTARAGKQGERNKRIWWAHQGFMRQWRVQRFRGANTGRVAFARLEAQLEPLSV